MHALKLEVSRILNNLSSIDQPPIIDEADDDDDDMQAVNDEAG